ncbi:phosphate ABC transporter substrate-binding protein PstS [Xylanimonas allomyrinae]|uniref:phosphate ABC transporter substrate-binding protein PstS n=1 Tax=Xylanimonas allomyrinae TaxID=2509459 RepID=UPI001FE531EA|nr:phosphate ABC transporter substrate-binding protein PstS [Xylanimonas allomyrinae]
MKPSRISRAGVAVLAGALALTLTACGSDDPIGRSPNAAVRATAGEVGVVDGPAVSGTFAGAGASSIEAAMDAWRAQFQGMHPGATVNYDPVGSGGGRRQFLAGGAVFAGSDNVLSAAEIEQSRTVCGPDGAIDLPIYVSPIAVAFNLPGIETLNLSPEVMARIFTGDLRRWDDPALVADNPGVDLPDLAVTPVHRSDDSGTTANFVDYLAAVAPDVWTWDVSGVWPLTGGDSAQGTSGVVNAVQQTVGAITYADASRVGDLGTAAVLVGGQWVGFSAEGAAAAVDASPRLAGRHEHDMAIALDRATDVAGAYPLLLVSYAVVCLQYETEADAQFVRSFMGFVVSDAGQRIAAQIAGSAPISADLADGIRGSLAAITHRAG